MQSKEENRDSAAGYPHAPAAAGGNSGGGSALGSSRLPLPLQRPPLPRELSLGPASLHSYLSEPPSTMAVMKSYAEELLHQQGPDGLAVQQQHGVEPAALAGARTVELQQLSTQRQHSTLGPAEGSTMLPDLAAALNKGGGPTSAQPRMRTSIGWAVSRSPSATSSIKVLEHRVAGDLIMPSRAVQLLGGAGAGAADVPVGSPSKDGGLRRRPMQRASQQSVPASPRGAVARVDVPAADRQASPLKKPDAGDDDEDELESLDYEARNKPWYKRKSFWLVAGPLLISLVFVLAGTLYITLARKETVSKFEIWRLCYFFAGLPIIWWIGRGSMELAVYGVERTMFTWQNALYYAYAVRRPMANVIRAGLTVAWWAIMMTAFSSNMDSTLLKWYNNVLKVLGCLALFMTANLLKVLFAKMMARKFNQHSHYAKMHQALKREYLVHTLLQPRQHYAELEEFEGEEAGGDAGGEDGDGSGGDMQRAHSAPGALQRKMSKQTSLQRLLRTSIFGGSKRGGPQLVATKSGGRSFKDKVMFWRGSHKNLHRIEEGEEGDEAQQEHSSGDAAKNGKLLPPDAVAVDISGDGRPTTPDSPLLSGSPTSAPLSPTPAAASKALASSRAAPGASPDAAFKLARHRSDLLEALGLPPAPAAQPSPRASSQQRGMGSGAATPTGRRRSGDGVQGEPERGRQLPRLRTTQNGAGGSDSVGGASRDPSATAPSVAARQLAQRAPRATADMKRSASLQSRLSAQAQGGLPATAAAKQRAMARSASASASSDRDSQKAIMAIKMSKMEKYIRKHALEVTFKDALSRVERSERVTSELEAKKLGFYLFHNVKADFERDHITLEDLERFLSESDAKAAMDMLDADGNGQVNVQECCGAIATVFVERRNLAASLKDARTIVGKLETVIGVVLHIFMFFLYLIIFSVDVLKVWATFASLFLGFSFVFGNSIRTTYENVVFLFVVHPYDIGEILFIDNDQCKVEEIHLSFTVLASSSNARIWYPNEKIRLVPFQNLTMSGPKSESFKVLVDIGCSTAVLDQLRAAGEAVAKANPKEFSPKVAVNLREGGGPMKLLVSVGYEFTHPGTDGGRTASNRTKMLVALSDALQKSGVRYTWPATAADKPAASCTAASTDEAAAATGAALLL